MSKLGYPELIMRTNGIRVIQQNTPKYDSTLAGLVDNAVKRVKEKVRVLVIGARELHGATIDRSHVTLPWYIRFAGQVLSRTVKGHDGTEELIVGNAHWVQDLPPRQAEIESRRCRPGFLQQCSWHAMVSCPWICETSHRRV